jgi:RNA polymerase sigma-70 factor (subfamily 1)
MPGDPAEDPKCLFDCAKGGDRGAFDRLVLAHRARIESFVRLRLVKALRQRIDPEDVVQESLLKAYSSIWTCEWRGEAAFYRWLATVAEHVLHDLERRHLLSKKAGANRELPLATPMARDESGLGQLGDFLRASGVSPSKAMRRDERFERLQSALDTLSPEHREVLLLARVQGVAVTDVARRLGKSRGAVSMLILRALRELRAAFGHTDSLGLPERSLEDGSPPVGDESRPGT